jgi:hypothetical protein
VFYMKRHQRKCQCCKKWFATDPRNHHHQRFCKRAGCRKASKIFSHKQWLAKPRTWKLWGGADEVDRVRTWRKLHPFYWKRTIPLISPKLNCASFHRGHSHPSVIMEQCFPAFGRGASRNHEISSPARTMSHDAPTPKRTVAYARRSSKHPQLSIARQMTLIRKYAKRRRLEVVMACSDGLKGDGKR